MRIRFSALYLLLFSGIILFNACSSAPKIQHYRVHISPADKAKGLVISRLNRDGQVIAVDTLDNENYVFEAHQPDVFFLEKSGQRLPLILGAGDVEVTLDSAKFTDSRVSGGAANDSLTAFREQMRELSKQQRDLFPQLRSHDQATKAKARETFFRIADSMLQAQYVFGERNLNQAGIIVLTGLTYQRNKDIDFKRIMDAYARYPETAKRSNAGKFLTRRLNTATVGQVGTQAPNFTGTTPDGQTLSLTQAMGKVTIIDFWASWCVPCRKNNPHLVALYKKYHDQGLNIISVSLDKSKDRWIQAIKKDGLNWYHVSHLKGWQEPIAQTYNISYIPQTLILDRTGKIQAKNLHGKSLDDKVRELLEKQ